MDQQSRELIAWLSPLEFPAQQKDIIQRRETGTGQWLLESDEFKTWLNKVGETMFCPGIPGAGKTMLASIVIDYLLHVILADDIGIVYLFCTYRDRLQQTPANLLGSLLKQLLQHKQTIPETLRNTYQLHINQGTRPSVDEIFSLLQSEITEFTRVYIVIDALDEYTDADGSCRLLLSKIRTLQADNAINLLATSRHFPHILQEFEKAICLEIRASDADVDKYLHGRMRRLPSFVAKKPGLQEMIKREITRSVNGM